MAAQRYLHIRVATSDILLPVAIVLSLLFWLLQGCFDDAYALGFVATIVCTGLILELNNTNVLLRVRSRMVSATFVFVWATCSFLLPLQVAHLTALGLIMAYHSLFHAYQQAKTAVDVFNAFLCIGVCVAFVPQLVLLVVPLVMALFWFQAMNAHSFFAMLLGLFVPFWFYGSYAYCTDSLPTLCEQLCSGWNWSVANYQTLTVSQVGIACWLLLLDGMAIVHLLRFSYKDKIRTRILFYFMAWMTVACVLLLVVFPQHFNVMLSLFIVNSSPLIAHYFTLNNGKVPRVVFVVALVLLLVLSVS